MSGVLEYELFGADLRRRYAQTDAKAKEVRRLLSPGGVTSHPVQAEVPIWMGYQGPKGARRPACSRPDCCRRTRATGLRTATGCRPADMTSPVRG